MDEADVYVQLYRVNLVPANLTGENPYWDGSEPFYDALFWSARAPPSASLKSNPQPDQLVGHVPHGPPAPLAPPAARMGRDRAVVR